MINDVEKNLKSEEKKNNDELITNEDATTTESSSRLIPITNKGFVFKKKNPNFKSIKKLENEKKFIIPKKDKTTVYSTMTKAGLDLENKIKEVGDEIKNKYEEDIVNKKQQMLIRAKKQSKQCKKEILRKRKNEESNNYNNIKERRHLSFHFLIAAKF